MKEYNGMEMALQYTKITLKSWFQYKVDAILRSLAVFAREATGIIVIYFTLQKFDVLNGWDRRELFFLYSFLFVTYGVLIVFFTGLRDFSQYIHSGKFDRFLLRPRGLLFQVITNDSDWFAAIGHGGLGIVLFIISANAVGIRWSVGTVVYYLFALVGGVLIQGAIFLILASLQFYLIKTNTLKAIFYQNMRKFAGYPISIYHKAIQYMMIYFIPFAFVNYFPAQFLLHKEDMNYPSAYMYAAPFVGVVLFLAAYGFWRVSVRFYKSTGN